MGWLWSDHAGWSSVCCMGFWQIHHFVVVCGLVVWLPPGVLWVLLFACSTHISSREGAGQFHGDLPLGYSKKSSSGRFPELPKSPASPEKVMEGVALHHLSLPPNSKSSSEGTSQGPSFHKEWDTHPSQNPQLQIVGRPLHWPLILPLPAFFGFYTWSEKSICSIGLILDLS